ncbi:MAG: HAD-IA family hydrolase [Treponema sp.]|nr:HAD-IA family hydrolase [Treponema sp.]
MKKAVIFDLDGTLLDTIEDIKDSVNHALEQFSLKTHSTDTIRSFVGNGFARLIELSVEGGKDNPLFTDVLNSALSWYAGHSQVKTKAYDGIKELLSALKEKGIKTAIVSNKPCAQVKQLAEIYFSDFMDSSLANGENEKAGIKRKPAPDMVTSLLSAMDVKPQEALYCGDSDVDIMTARNAGLDCVSVSWGFKSCSFLEEFGADKIIDTPLELLKYIQD